MRSLWARRTASRPDNFLPLAEVPFSEPASRSSQYAFFERDDGVRAGKGSVGDADFRFEAVADAGERTAHRENESALLRVLGQNA